MFTWMPIFAEITQRLEEFQFKNAELVELLVEMHREGLKASPYMDRDEAGAEFQLEETDPFTFLANLNRPVTDLNRKAVIGFLKNEWSLDAAVPADFAGLPVVNGLKNWFMPFKFKRATEHVATLWRLFLHCRQVSNFNELDTQQFDACTALKGVGLSYLTMGMFWSRPELWIALDKKNIAYAKILVSLDKPRDGAEYLHWLKSVHRAITVPTWQFSQDAHARMVVPVNDKGPESSKELADPYCRLFDDVEQASEILDLFAQVITELGSDENDSVTVISFSERGRTGGQMRVIYGGWAVFGYRRRANDTSFQILLPDNHAAISKIGHSYRFTAPDSGEVYVMGWVDDDWLFENWQSIWSVVAQVLRKVRNLFADWYASPYGNSHVAEFFSLIVNPEEREEILRTPLKVDVQSEFAYWLLAPGHGASLWDESRERGIGIIGWDEVGDLKKYRSKDEIEAKAETLELESSPKAVASMLWYFCGEIKAGDVVFSKNGLFKVCGWGIVTGNYKFDDSRPYFKHTLPIDWKSDVETKTPEGMQLAGKSLTPMSMNRAFLNAMATRYSGIPGLSEIEGPTSDAGTPPSIRYTREDALQDLFMSESKLDRILQQLKRKKNVILQGAPGTGKTFIARRIAYLLMGEKDPHRAPMVQFHQSTAYEDFIQGYRPAENGHFVLKNGGFHEFCERARRQPEKPFVYIIDEINRGNLSKVFGELLMLIEHDKRNSEFAIPLTYAKTPRETFFIPANVHLIGTMNTADRSLSMVDYALRRRFSFIDLEPGFDSPEFARYLNANGASADLITSIRQRMTVLNQMITKDSTGLGRGYRIGHSYFVPTIGHPANENWLEEVIECEVIPLLEEYWCDDETQLFNACQVARGRK